MLAPPACISGLKDPRGLRIFVLPTEQNWPRLWEWTCGRIEFARLTHDPLNASAYWNLLRTDDPARMGRVIFHAEKTLPLAEIGSGPADEMGLCPAFLPHRCLGMLLQEMRRPGVFSQKLVMAGLRSPVVNNRNMAITALEHHPVQRWGQEVMQVVRQALAEEPRDDVRERLCGLVGQEDDPVWT